MFDIEQLLINHDLLFESDERTKTILIRSFNTGKCDYKYYVGKNKLHRIYDNAFFIGKSQIESEIYRYVHSDECRHNEPVGVDCEAQVPQLRNPLRQRFVAEAGYTRMYNNTLIVAVVQLPSGAREVITNSEHIPEKLEYYMNAYDDQFRLKANPEVKIVGIMII